MVLTADRRRTDYMRQLGATMFLACLVVNCNILTLAREQSQEVPESCQRCGVSKLFAGKEEREKFLGFKEKNMCGGIQDIQLQVTVVLLTLGRMLYLGRIQLLYD